MFRSLRSFIRGVKHNIPLLKKIVRHPVFLSSEFTTHFFAQHQSLFNYIVPRDRATKLLRFIGEVTINDPHGLETKRRGSVADIAAQFGDHQVTTGPSAKSIFDSQGASGLTKWICEQKSLLFRYHHA